MTVSPFADSAREAPVGSSFVAAKEALVATFGGDDRDPPRLPRERRVRGFATH